MTDEDAKLLNEDERGRRAAELLANPLLREAIETLRREYADISAATGFRQRDERDELWRLQQTLKRFLAHIETVAQTGNLARAQLRELSGRTFGIF